MLDAVAPTVEAMRAALDGVFAGRLRHVFDGVWVTLERAGDTWTLDLLSAAGRLTHGTCDRLAAQVSAPSVEWTWHNAGHASAEWRE